MLLLRRALFRWVLTVVAVPVVAGLADLAGRRLEVARGPSRMSRGLRTGAARLRRFDRRRGRR
jgi:hypothetical protein